MEVYGKGSIQQADKGKTRARCRKWRIFVKTSEGTKTKTVEGGLRDAQRMRDLFVEDLKEQVTGRDTFTGYADAWLGYRKMCGGYSPNTVRKDATNIRALSDALGNIALRDITSETVSDAITELSEGRSGTYMNCIYRTLNSIMRAAQDDGYIIRNPCARIRAPKTDTKERVPLDRDELERLLDTLDRMPIDGRVMAFYFMSMLALRCGEALGLFWEDVEGGKVSVRRSLKAADMSIAEPKSDSGVRLLPMPERLARKLETWRTVYDAACFSGDTVCCDTEGNVLHPNNLRKWAKKNGLPTAFHTLRHSNLTLVAREVPSSFDLQHYAGWSDLSSARIYVHENFDALSDAVDALDL